jgi:hypothetical protein
MAIKTELIEKLIAQSLKKQKYPIRLDEFLESANRYIKATKERRLMCNIESVSSSGMRRTMSFFEMRKNPYSNEYMVTPFFNLFDALGYKESKNGRSYIIDGCGMDMIFATHYNIINELYKLGLINRPTRAKLEQMTPHKI